MLFLPFAEFSWRALYRRWERGENFLHLRDYCYSQVSIDDVRGDEMMFCNVFERLPVRGLLLNYELRLFSTLSDATRIRCIFRGYFNIAHRSVTLTRCRTPFHRRFRKLCLAILHLVRYDTVDVGNLRCGLCGKHCGGKLSRDLGTSDNTSSSASALP